MPMIQLPALPAKHRDLLPFIHANSNTPIHDLLKPYYLYESTLREVYAQQPDHPAIIDPLVNAVALFQPQPGLVVQSRSVLSESHEQQEKYILPLNHEDRKPAGTAATVGSLKEFQSNFNLFSEAALTELDWSNVVAAGSSVVTSLLPIPENYAASKRLIREYYHEKVASASDVDLFLYGLTEDEAVEKIKQIERSIKDSVLHEVTTVRTKNAITVVSQYPTRHVQIVLRLYKSVSEILTGFDVDCSCAAYDGKEVYATPRALAAYVTQRNMIDLTRRSPSYESRLSKYGRRGFEVYWPELERGRIDPTIFERSFSRTLGLARLLVLEKLPRNADREAYLDQRRQERGRPARPWRRDHKLHGNIKDDEGDEIAEWAIEDDVSDYHTCTIPYGPKFHAKNIERLLYIKDLLLNAEWNKKKDREVNLHRHPVFFGQASDVIDDCCGYCPLPTTPAEIDVASEEGKIYVSGRITFMHDNPGRQAIGSFNPISADDWTDMAYVGNTARLCQAIVDKDIGYVKEWFRAHEDVDVNQRDYTGRTLLHLAVICSTLEIVQYLIDRGVRIVARLIDGKTALHLAAIRGDVAMVKALLMKSEANKEKEAERERLRQESKSPKAEPDEGSDIEVLSDHEESEDEATAPATEASFVNIRDMSKAVDTDNLFLEDEDQPDVYDVDVEIWDAAVNSLQFAIINSRAEVVKELVENFGSNITAPIKIRQDDQRARGVIMTPVLATRLSEDAGRKMLRLLLDLGASSAQADMNHTSVLQYIAAHAPGWLEILIDNDGPAVQLAINQLTTNHRRWQSPLTTAIRFRNSEAAFTLLAAGARPEILFEHHSHLFTAQNNTSSDFERNIWQLRDSVEQPVLTAARFEMASLAKRMIELGSDPNTLDQSAWQVIRYEQTQQLKTGFSILDIVREKLKHLRDGHGQAADITPKALKDDAAYLSDLSTGTYKLWRASIDLHEAKQALSVAREGRTRTQTNASTENVAHIEAKSIAIGQLIKDFEALEATILSKGGKTFGELYPEIASRFNPRRWHHTAPKDFEISFKFCAPDLSDYRQQGYERLFEAAWNGDLVAVKRMTLARWGPSEDRMPLQIATTDANSISPFAIAVFRGHLDLAKIILEIALAQYEPEEKPNVSYRVSLFESHASEDTDDSGNEDEMESSNTYKVRVRSELVDDQFTVDLVSKLGQQVKSRVKPTDLLYATLPLHRFFDDGSVTDLAYQSKLAWDVLSDRNGETPSPSLLRSYGLRYDSFSRSHTDGVSKIDSGTLLKYATILGDTNLTVYLLNLGAHFTRLEATEDIPNIPWISSADFLFALKLGRIQIAAEMIRRSGSGIPFTTMAQASGVELPDRPKYYQGLTVNGKKRADWSNKTFRSFTRTNTEFNSPLLEAARFGSLEGVEWLLSDAPVRHYVEFVEAHQDDDNLKLLALIPGGATGAIKKFLKTHDELLVHCATLAPPKSPRQKLLEYAINAGPSSVDAKSPVDGHTPLHIAFSLARVDAARTLINAGADQTARDKNGNNILHFLLVPIKTSFPTPHSLNRITDMLKLIDHRILQTLFLERSSGPDPSSTTPLAKWISLHSKHDLNTPIDDRAVTILTALLDSSSGADLSLVDGSGDTPLHIAIRNRVPEFTRLIAARAPALLHRENATGRTPLEVARDAWTADVFAHPPSIEPRGGTPFSIVPYYYGVSPEEFDSVAAPATDFATGDAERKARRRARMSAVEATWRVCEEIGHGVQDSAVRRKLVSLAEANEVARRLAARQRDRGTTSEVLRDEVDVFFPEAQQWDLAG